MQEISADQPSALEASPTIATLDLGSPDLGELFQGLDETEVTQRTLPDAALAAALVADSEETSVSMPSPAVVTVHLPLIPEPVKVPEAPARLTGQPGGSVASSEDLPDWLQEAQPAFWLVHSEKSSEQPASRHLDARTTSIQEQDWSLVDGTETYESTNATVVAETGTAGDQIAPDTLTEAPLAEVEEPTSPAGIERAENSQLLLLLVAMPALFSRSPERPRCAPAVGARIP